VQPCAELGSSAKPAGAETGRCGYGARGRAIHFSSRVNPIVILALVRRDLLVATSYRLGPLVTFTYAILGLAIYFYISRIFGDPSSNVLGDAPSYFAFAATGVVVGVVLDVTSSSVGARLREEQQTGTLETLGTTPVSSLELTVGLIGFPFLLAALQTVVYLGIAVVWMELDATRTSWFGVATMLLVSGIASTPFGVLAGASVLIFKRSGIISATLLYGMTLLSGMLFPVSVLPDWISPLSRVIPITYAFEGTRSALFQGTSWLDDVLILSIWSALSLPLSVLLFDWAGGRARRAGSMSEY